jgi:hypothetical protein
MLINSKLFGWKNILIIFLVAVVAHHFAKGWFKNTPDTSTGDDNG